MLGLHLLVSTKWAESDSAEYRVVVSYFLPWTRLECGGVEGVCAGTVHGLRSALHGKEAGKTNLIETLHADQLFCTKH